jgi:hypothetical protein
MKWLLNLLMLFLAGTRHQASFTIKASPIDTLGIEITANQYDSMVQNSLVKFRSHNSAKSIDDYLTLVKICNTIAFDDLETKDKLELFSLFRVNLDTIVKVTDAILSNGGSFYSEKYSILIGGYRTKNNFYRIENQPKSIRFIYYADIMLKPRGTLLIRTDSLTRPTDEYSNLPFSKWMVTDKETFGIIEKYIWAQKSTSDSSWPSTGNREGYIIIDEIGTHFDLHMGNFNVFFGDLVHELQAKNADKAVVASFKNYYKNWWAN